MRKLTPRVSDSGGLRICISNKIPGGVELLLYLGPQGEPLSRDGLEKDHRQSRQSKKNMTELGGIWCWGLWKLQLLWGTTPSAKVRKEKTFSRAFWWEARWISEEGMATHSSDPAAESQGTEEPGGLQSIRLQGVRQNWSDLASVHAWWISQPMFQKDNSNDKVRVLGLSESRRIHVGGVSESHSVMSDSLQPHDYMVHGILQARLLEWVAGVCGYSV